MSAPDLMDWFAELESRTQGRREAIEQAYIELRNSGLLSKVTLHRYMCRRGCQLAVVFRVAGQTLCATRDYKQSPGLNAHASVEAARRDRTLDGDRHWPAMVYDVAEIAEFGAMLAACRHFRGQLVGADVLTAVEGVRPGQPKAPTRL